jgi:hypothetical protein
MSLTNPNTVVTEERLNDFYKGILPYLGGMPEMVANKFSKGDLYSTDEKMIGQWVDGKPLYQKTIYFEALSNMSYVTKPHGVSDLGEVVFLTGIASNGVARNIIPFAHDQSVASQILLMVNGADIEIDNRGYDYSTFHAYVTFQYTKTTDSPISIGNDTDYSTEEKIIGTWIDGKPIYQKTITGLNIKFNWVSTQVTMASNVDALIGDVDTIIKIPHAIMENNSGTQTTCNVDIQNQGTKWNLVSVEDYYLKNITIQYTKTTD